MVTSAEKPSVFLIMDDENLRSALARDLLAIEHDVYEYSTAVDFLIDRHKYSKGVVVSSLHLRIITGPQLAKQLRPENRMFPVIIMAAHSKVSGAIASSPAEVLVTPVTAPMIAEAVVRVTEGESFTTLELESAFGELTARELEVAEFVVHGKSNSYIGEALKVSGKTIEAHRKQIMRKTQAEDVGHLLRKWRAWKEWQ